MKTIQLRVQITVQYLRLNSGQNLIKAVRNGFNSSLKSIRNFFSFGNNSGPPTTTTAITTPSPAEYCPTVKPSDRVDCAGLFPGNDAVHNKAGCEALGCCHSPINVAGPWCFQAPWTPIRGRRSGKYSSRQTASDEL